MASEFFDLNELSKHLGRDRRELEKMAGRGKIPGRKVAGEWKFHSTEITHWLEQEIREYSDHELATVEASQQNTEAEEVTVSNLLKIETTQVPLKGRTKRSILEELVEVAGRTWHVWEPAVVLQAVQEREEVLATGMENGIAIPHPRNSLPHSLGESVISFGKTTSGIPFGAPKRALNDLFFLVLCRDTRTHLRVLARLSRMMQLDDFVDELRATETSQQAYDLISQVDDDISQPRS